MRLFSPRDFAIQYPDEPLSEVEAAAIANRLLEKIGVTVYGYGETAGASSLWNMNGPGKDDILPHTHKALLINIEELPKKECEHTNIIAVGMPDELSKSGPYFELKQPRIDCVDCGKELRVHK